MPTKTIGKFTVFLSISFALFIIVQLISSGFFAYGLFFDGEKNPVVEKWNYFYSDDLDKVEESDPSGSILLSSSSLSFNTGHNYLKLSRSYTELNTDDVIAVDTGFAPCKILINGKHAYDNGFNDDEAFTNEKIVRYYIKEHYSECKVEIYLSIHTGSSISVWTERADVNNQLDLLDIFVFLISAIIITIGILFIAYSLFVSTMNSQFNCLMTLGALLTACGLLSLAGMLNDNFRMPALEWFRIQNALTMLIGLFGLCIVFMFNGKWRTYQYAIVSSLVLYILVFIFIPDKKIALDLYKYGAFISCFALVMIFEAVYRCVVKYKPMRMVMIISLLFSTQFYVINSVYRVLPNQNVAVVIFALMLSFSFGFEFLNQTIYSDIRKNERQNQSLKNSILIEKISDLNEIVLSSTSFDDYCKNIAKSLKSVMIVDTAPTDEKAAEIPPILKATVAVKENGLYRIVYTEEANPTCDFSVIENRIIRTKATDFIFGVASVDTFLKKDGEVYLICHINGLNRALSENLKNLLKTAYNNLLNAFDNLHLKNEIVQTQHTLFLNLADITEAKSSNTGHHIRRVALYCETLAREYGFSEEETELISSASMMHDLGKLAINEKIIQKKGQLTKYERAVMKNHVVWGYNILSSVPGKFMKAAAVIAQQHHERWDGSGYIGLIGDETNIYARIVAVADVFDALTTERSYKEAWTLNEARIFINEQADRHFARDIVDAFNNSFTNIVQIHNEYKD